MLTLSTHPYKFDNNCIKQHLFLVFLTAHFFIRTLFSKLPWDTPAHYSHHYFSKTTEWITTKCLTYSFLWGRRCSKKRCFTNKFNWVLNSDTWNMRFKKKSEISNSDNWAWGSMPSRGVGMHCRIPDRYPSMVWT